METEARGGAEAGHKAWCFAPRPGSAEAGLESSEGACGLRASDLGPDWRRRRYLGNQLLISVPEEVHGGVRTETGGRED